MDRYASFEDLRREEPEESHRIRLREGSRGVAIIAPHGGFIEPGTSEVADEIAGSEYTLYCFEGARDARNFELHITSANFDEPVGSSIVERADIVIAIHGCKGEEDVVSVGGLNDRLGGLILAALKDADFPARKGGIRGFRGIDPRNICNRGRTGKGVQIEISRGLRRKMRSTQDATSGKAAEETLRRLAGAIRKAITLALEDELGTAPQVSSSIE
jgi:phage replication-related protein YjqB (UPF0714/DUF867 family)